MDEDTRDVQLGLIAEISTLLEAEDLAHWLYGGWGIDFLVGAVTRDHHDIDFVVWAKDGTRIRALLEEYGYMWQFTRYTDERHVFVKHGQRIDIDFIE